MKTITLAAIALIASVNAGLAKPEQCSSDAAAFLRTMPSQQERSHCTYGVPADAKCQKVIDNWMAAMAKEKQRCEKRAGND